MAEPFIGQIMLVPYNFPPRGWAFCQGQILSIAQNTALFSLLGTTFGGNGQTTFALPDLRGRVPVSSGQGPGLSNYTLGEAGGNETHTLITNEMPSHTHTASVNATTNVPNTARPTNSVPATGQFYNNEAGSINTTMSPNMVVVQPAGGNQPFSVLQPFLTLNFCIALEGIYPPRD